MEGFATVAKIMSHYNNGLQEKYDGVECFHCSKGFPLASNGTMFYKWFEFGANHLFVFCNRQCYLSLLEEAKATAKHAELKDRITQSRFRRIKVVSGGLPSLGKRR